MLEFAERGNEVIFGDAVEKYIVGAELHVHSLVCDLSASLGTIDGRKPSYFMSDWAIQEGFLFVFNKK